MYLGRIVAIAMNKEGNVSALYRVSSRSFPNRETVRKDDIVSVMPRAGFEDDLKKNPYITYNCVRFAGSWAVVSNGSQTDPIAEKIAMGYPVRDAMTIGLLAMDYEKDSYNTPRIVAAVDSKSNVGYLGIVRHDAVAVRPFELTPGKLFYLSTYEKNFPCQHNFDGNFDAETAEAACRYSIDGGVFADFSNPVTAAAVLLNGENFELATMNA